MAKLLTSVLFLGIAATCGCGSGDSGGPPLGTVTGTVKHNGQPLKGGMVTFFQSGRPYAAEIGSSGTYTARPAVGKCTVIVEHREAGQQDPKAPPPGRLLPGKSLIPEKYGNVATSGLSFDVASGSSEFNIELKD